MQPERRNGKINHWTLDKRIQLPLIFLLITQIVAGVWFAAGIVSKIESHDKEIILIKSGQSEIRRVSDKMIRLEVLLETMTEKLEKIDRKANK